MDQGKVPAKAAKPGRQDRFSRRQTWALKFKAAGRPLRICLIMSLVSILFILAAVAALAKWPSYEVKLVLIIIGLAIAGRFCLRPWIKAWEIIRLDDNIRSKLPQGMWLAAESAMGQYRQETRFFAERHGEYFLLFSEKHSSCLLAWNGSIVITPAMAREGNFGG